MHNNNGEINSTSRNNPSNIKNNEGISINQWKIIDSIIKKYKGKTVHGTDSKFEDEIWKDDKYKIYWSSHIHNDYPIIRLLMKCYAFEEKKIRKNTISHIRTKCIDNIKELTTALISNKIIINKEGEQVIGLSMLNDEILLGAIDLSIVSVERNINTVVDKINSIYKYFNFLRLIVSDIPFLRSHIEFPWEKSNQTVRDWTEQRIIDIEHFIHESRGYKALPAETYYPLIEKSMLILDKLEDEILGLYDMKLNSPRNNTALRLSSLDRIHEKYGKEFSIINMEPYYTEKNYLSMYWVNEIIHLAKGACINIILLTTGLRNSDLRDLTVNCCKPSEHIDSLYYISAKLNKTSNNIHIPVPPQTFQAISLLSKLKSSDSKYLLDSGLRTKEKKSTALRATGTTVNAIIRAFAKHFEIPFAWDEKDTDYVSHCYRSTVAGFLSESSNLSIIMIRRLFGHSNDLMPTFYQRNNPIFVRQQKEDHELAAKESASIIANATIDGRVAGPKGEDIKRGFDKFKQESLSMTDKELRQSFEEMVNDRLLNGSTCGFLTPFGVLCMRNPTDSSQPPCSKRSHKDISKEIDPEIIDFLSAIDPPNCIGIGCSESMIGPWSKFIIKSLVDYKKIVKHQYGDLFSEEHFIEHAKSFIKTYEPLIKEVFGENYDKE